MNGDVNGWLDELGQHEEREVEVSDLDRSVTEDGASASQKG
jgi:hypothetical protein